MEATGVATCGVWVERALSGARLSERRDPALALGALMEPLSEEESKGVLG